MSTENCGPGPYRAYDDLPVLRASEALLPKIHPYADVRLGQHITPGGGRLTLEQRATHFTITLDHFGCPAQSTLDKDAAFKTLALAAEGLCHAAGCRHRAAYRGGVLRKFEILKGTALEIPAFVRALLAIELGDMRPATVLARRTQDIAGPPKRPAGTGNQRSASL
ncbi:DUF6420 family protein [Streptomyces sp. NPDC006339]|uniref:DUF6420 family protein n=1 Tax=Streptomyces sp. NPDC006339 TaxID=3156755 RepID=UPI00339FCE9B